MSESIFTKIINRTIPADIVYENDMVIAFKDIAPKAPVHVLIVPKKLIPTINDISAEDANYLSAILLSAKEIATLLGIEKDGYRLIMNCNEHGGQTVYHIHCHLLGGRQLVWTPG